MTLVKGLKEVANLELLTFLGLLTEGLLVTWHCLKCSQSVILKIAVASKSVQRRMVIVLPLWPFDDVCHWHCC